MFGSAKVVTRPSWARRSSVPKRASAPKNPLPMLMDNEFFTAVPTMSGAAPAVGFAVVNKKWLLGPLPSFDQLIPSCFKTVRCTSAMRTRRLTLPSSSTTGGPVGRMLAGPPVSCGGVAVGDAMAEDLSTSAALTATHSINPDAVAATVRRLRITIPCRQLAVQKSHPLLYCRAIL